MASKHQEISLPQAAVAAMERLRARSPEPGGNFYSIFLAFPDTVPPLEAPVVGPGGALPDPSFFPHWLEFKIIGIKDYVLVASAWLAEIVEVPDHAPPPAPQTRLASFAGERVFFTGSVELNSQDHYVRIKGYHRYGGECRVGVQLMFGF